jgi:hypothetical protein
LSDDAILVDLSRLSAALQGEAESFPWSVPTRERATWEEMWWWWNVGFVHAAGRLCLTVEILNAASLSDEAMLHLRSLLELVANQGYMAKDPERRAPEYAEADLEMRGRHLEGLLRLGADAEAIEKLKDETADIRGEMAPLIEDVELKPSILPFGRKASARAEAAGLTRQYDGVYVVASDYVHMNVRAVSQYVSRAQGQREQQKPLGSKLVMACEFLLRSLYLGDLAVEQGRTKDLDVHAVTHAQIVFPNVDAERVVQNLWPTSARPA